MALRRYSIRADVKKPVLAGADTCASRRTNERGGATLSLVVPQGRPPVGGATGQHARFPRDLDRGQGGGARRLTAQTDRAIMQHPRRADRVRVDLVGQQVHKAAFVALARHLAPVGQEIVAGIIGQQVHRIHHRHHRVQPGHIGEIGHRAGWRKARDEVRKACAIADEHGRAGPRGARIFPRHAGKEALAGQLLGVDPDRVAVIVDALIALADRQNVDLIVTTGGTGVAPTDVTPEAMLQVIDKEVPGMAEAMRAPTGRGAATPLPGTAGSTATPPPMSRANLEMEYAEIVATRDVAQRGRTVRSRRCHTRGRATATVPQTGP